MTPLEIVPTYGPACFIANKPRSGASRPPVERKPLDLLSRNGRRLPLRALAWRDLNREFWSQGKVVYGDALERSQARELSAHEKRVEDMTLDELAATQDREPLSESRRSWLTRGAGVLSLEGVAYGEGSIGEMLAAKGNIGALATMEIPEEQTFADEASSIGNGVPYELLDPITAKQIEWEQRVYYDEPVVRVKIAAKSDGGLALATDRKLMPDAFMRLARSVKRTLLDSDSGWDATEHRFRMIDDAAARLGFASADANEERERFLAPADDEWHSSYEMPVAVIVHDGTGTPALFPCMRCDRPFVHRHERITRIVHRGTTRSKDELWRNRIFDITSFEMGTDGLVDPLVSF